MNSSFKFLYVADLCHWFVKMIYLLGDDFYGKF